MTTNLKVIQDLYKGKDSRGEKYFYTIKAIDDDGTEVILIDHVGNPNATGSKLLQNTINRVKNDYDKLIIEEYRSKSPGRNGAVSPVQVHDIPLKENKPAKLEGTELFNAFGGLHGFIGFTREQARIEGENQAFNQRLDELRAQNSQLLTKLGTYESEIKKLESEIRRKEDMSREVRWQYEDKIRDLQTEHEKELRKYKGQSAIINAGVQGLGSLLMKKLNVSGTDLAGLLGLDTEEQPQQAAQPTMQNVHVEPDNVSPEIRQKADLIYNWLLKTDVSTMDKVYRIFESIASSEQNLNDIYDLTTNPTDEI
jgi:hypothetical protein